MLAVALGQFSPVMCACRWQERALALLSLPCNASTATAGHRACCLTDADPFFWLLALHCLHCQMPWKAKKWWQSHTTHLNISTPRHKTKTCRKNILSIFRANACGAVSALAQLQEHMFEEPPSLCMDTVAAFTRPWWQYVNCFWRINYGANTRGACICTQANTGNYSWRIIYVLVSYQAVQRH